MFHAYLPCRTERAAGSAQKEHGQGGKDTCGGEKEHLHILEQ